MNRVTVQGLVDELLSRAKGVAAFRQHGFSVFDIEDLYRTANNITPPIVGVIYDGAMPASGNQGTPAEGRPAAQASLFVTLQFSVIIGVQYTFSGQGDHKEQATNLLDDMRSMIIGFSGVNHRPWIFSGEKPEKDVSGEGMLFYSQIWQTSCSMRRNQL